MKFNKIFKLLDLKDKKKLLFLSFLMALNPIAELFSLALIIPIIGLVVGKSTNFLNLNTYIENMGIAEDRLFLFVVSLFLVLQLLKLIFLLFYKWFEIKFVYDFKGKTSSNLWKKYLNQNYIFFFKNNSSNLLRNITYSVDCTAIYLFGFLQFILDLLVGLTILIFLLFYEPFVTTMTLFIFIIFSSIYLFSLRGKLNAYGEARRIHAAQRLKFFQESIENIKFIKFSNQEEFFFKKFQEHNFKNFNLSFKADFLKNIPRPLLELAGICITVTILVYLKELSTTTSEKLFEILGLYVFAFLRLLPCFSRMLSNFQSMKLNYPEIHNLYNESNIKISKDDKFKEDLLFDNLIEIKIKKFVYENNKKFTLKNVDIKLGKKEKIAIFGASGSGKSTFLDLFTGILKPTEGDILVDNKSIYQNLKSWQNLIGYVPQKVTVMDDSLRNNILFGEQQSKNKDQIIIDLMKKTNLTYLLNRLDFGLDTPLAEKGINLSGGELQRIGICRALVKNPEILILDEATSALDEETEKKILDEIKTFYDKTIIFISHKMISINRFDKVFKISKGNITSTKKINNDKF